MRQVFVVMLDRHAQCARFVDHHGKLCGRKGDALP
jgi:hypothetical protein